MPYIKRESGNSDVHMDYYVLYQDDPISPIWENINCTSTNSNIIIHSAKLASNIRKCKIEGEITAALHPSNGGTFLNVNRTIDITERAIVGYLKGEDRYDNKYSYYTSIAYKASKGFYFTWSFDTIYAQNFTLEFYY